jgi:hypothetical protein
MFFLILVWLICINNQYMPFGWVSVGELLYIQEEANYEHVLVYMCIVYLA